MIFKVDQQCDSQQWDQFVSKQPSGNLMQSYAWGEFQRGRGWTPGYGQLKEGDEIQAAVLLLSRTVPGIPGKIYYAPRGPVVDYTDRAATERLFEELNEYVNQTGGVFLRCDPYWVENKTLNGETPPSVLSRVPRDWSYWNLPRFVFWLNLAGDESEAMGRMTSRCRNDVRRGHKNEVVFTNSRSEGLGDFHRLMALTAKHKGIAFHGVEYYEQLLSVVSSSADVQLFIGRHEGKAITAGISAVFGQKAWLFYAASAPESYKLRANRTQQWEMIKWAHGEGCERYDFRGTATNDPPSEKDPGYGVYQFKKSFGPEFTRLTGYYDLISGPLRYRSFRLAEEYGLPAAYRVRTMLQGSPD